MMNLKNLSRQINVLLVLGDIREEKNKYLWWYKNTATNNERSPRIFVRANTLPSQEDTEKSYEKIVRKF